MLSSHLLQLKLILDGLIYCVFDFGHKILLLTELTCALHSTVIDNNWQDIRRRLGNICRGLRHLLHCAGSRLYLIGLTDGLQYKTLVMSHTNACFNQLLLFPLVLLFLWAGFLIGFLKLVPIIGHFVKNLVDLF